MSKKEVFRGLFMALWIGIAATPLGFAIAQIVPALPFNLTNNTTADATQVMANFNQLLSNINANSAKNGINSDITSLIGLTTPLAPGVGGTNTFTGGTSTGSANAYVVATVVPNTFTLSVGARVVFVASFSNTDASTINVSGTGLKPIARRTQVGNSTLIGGEILTSDVVSLVYDGGSFQLENYRAQVGEIQAYTGSVPAGWAYADGSCVSSSKYAVLLSISGSWNGSCGGGTFGIADLRGSAIFGRDNMGSGAANRLTFGGSGCGATSVSVACGTQAQAITQAQLPNYTLSNTLGVSRSGSVSLGTAAGGVLNNQGVGGGANVTGGGGAYNVGALTISDTQSWGITGSVTSGGGGANLLMPPPLQIANYIVKL